MYYLGIDIGGTTIKAGVVTEETKVLHKESMPTVIGDDENGFVEAIVTLVHKTLCGAGIGLSDLCAIGVGCPGIIDDEKGIVVDAGNLKLRNFPLREELKKHFTIPIFLNNDANCAALGEYRALNNSKIGSLIMITLGTGIGGGIILNQKIYTGYNGMGGEFGHMILCMDGRPCACGQRGCWETYASAGALVRDAAKAAKEHPESVLNTMLAQKGGSVDGEMVFQALRRKDNVIEKVFEDYIKYLGEGLISIINVFQPEVIVVGGGLGNSGDSLLIPLKKYIAQNSNWLQCEKRTEIRSALLGNNAGIIGASNLGRQ